MLKGRPFQPGNQFGRGRPPGSRNKRTLFAQELLDSHAEALVRQALVLALKGDSPMLRFLVPYILPRPKRFPLNTGPLPIGSAAELSQSSDKLMKKVTSGQISPSEALEITDLINHRRRIIRYQQ